VTATEIVDRDPEAELAELGDAIANVDLTVDGETENDARLRSR
jgi:hypothetical protein